MNSFPSLAIVQTTELIKKERENERVSVCVSEREKKERNVYRERQESGKMVGQKGNWDIGNGKSALVNGAYIL